MIRNCFRNSKWVWSGNITITNYTQIYGTSTKNNTTITRHHENNISKANSSLFPIKAIANIEWTQSNAQQVRNTLKQKKCMLFFSAVIMGVNWLPDLYFSGDNGWELVLWQVVAMWTVCRSVHDGLLLLLPKPDCSHFQPLHVHLSTADLWQDLQRSLDYNNLPWLLDSCLWLRVS